jgi:outer membrane lipoprotein-sorting protein
MSLPASTRDECESARNEDKEKTMNRMMKLTTALVIAFMGVIAASASAQEDAEQIMKKSHLAYYYAGDDGVAEVDMRIVDKKGKERIRSFAMLRLDLEEGGNQKYYTYFKKPSDVARMTFMVHKNSGGNDLRWIYVPAVDLVKPISADDKNSSFVGSDFSYEDVSGRHWSEDTHAVVADSTWDGAAVYVIESRPKAPYGGFALKRSYVNKQTLLPHKELYFNDKGDLIKVMTAEEIKDVDGIMTIVHRTMEDVKKERVTHVIFSNIRYNVGIEDNLFTERFLKNPPMQYVR